MKKLASTIVLLFLFCFVLNACDKKSEEQPATTPVKRTAQQIEQETRKNMAAFKTMVDKHYETHKAYPQNLANLYRDAQTQGYFIALKNPVDTSIQWNENNSSADGVIQPGTLEDRCHDNESIDVKHPVAAGTVRYFVSETGYAIRGCNSQTRNTAFLNDKGIQLILAGGDMATM